LVRYLPVTRAGLGKKPFRLVLFLLPAFLIRLVFSLWWVFQALCIGSLLPLSGVPSMTAFLFAAIRLCNSLSWLPIASQGGSS
jgi:hypothetical protein